MATHVQTAAISSDSASGERSGSLEPAQFPSPPMFSPLGCCDLATEEPGVRRQRYQERKLRMLTFWRDGLERQLAAVNAAMATLEQQMERDRASAQG